MIRKLEFSNFFSFHSGAELNLLVGKRAPSTEAYFLDGFGDRTSKLMGIFGANASGKTNLLKGISFLAWFIADSFEVAPDSPIPFKPFLFSSAKRPSKFKLEFETKETIYQYDLEVTAEKVLYENLSYKDVKTKHFKTLFKRRWNSKKSKYEYGLRNFDAPPRFAQIVPENASVISAGRQLKHKVSESIALYFDRVISNIKEGGRAGIGELDQLKGTLKFFQENPAMREKAEEILGKFDTGLSKINIQRIETRNGGAPIYDAAGTHRLIDGDEEVMLPIRYESHGTKNLLILLESILVVLQDGGVAVLDEFDNDLHPLMLPEILNLFVSKIYNPKNAQLVFSSHSPLILNHLDKQQIMFVEKNEKGISEAIALQDIKGVRPGDSFYTKYLAGAYGGIPKM